MLFYDVVQNQNPWKQKVGNTKSFQSPGFSALEHRLKYFSEIATRIYGAKLFSSKLQQNFHPRKKGILKTWSWPLASNDEV